MSKKDIKIEANGEFPFTFYIEKAMVVDEGDEWIIEGVASTTNIDHDNERMAPEALVSMAEVINDSSVPLRVEHSKSDNAVVGKVFKAWIDERNQLWIKAALDKTHAASPILYKSLKDGIKLGLSVGGRVKHAVKEIAESAGKMVKTFYQVLLDEVSVTQHPANYDSYLIRKSIIKDGYNIDGVEEGFQKDFLFETRANDYLYTIAKSIPDDAWKNVELKDYNKDMTKKEKEMSEEETKEKAEETETSTKEKAEEKETETETTKSESAFKSMVVKSLENLTAIVSKLTKTETTSETKEKNEETTIMEEESKTKEGTTKEKAEGSTEEESDKEKGMDDGETKESVTNKKEKKEETETEEKATSGDEYKMKNLLKRMSDLVKAMDETTEETKEKDAKDTEEDETTKSIDDFVEGISKAIDSMEERVMKSGNRIPGLHQQIVSMLQNDAEFQKSVKDLLKVPGPKRSVSMGVPFMKSKDGKMYRLTPVDASEEVTKSSRVEGKSFKELYKSDFSSVAEANSRG